MRKEELESLIDLIIDEVESHADYYLGHTRDELLIDLRELLKEELRVVN